MQKDAVATSVGHKRYKTQTREEAGRHHRDTGKHISWISGVHTEFRAHGSSLYLPDDIGVETERGAGALQSVITEHVQTTDQQQQKCRKYLPQPCTAKTEMLFLFI